LGQYYFWNHYAAAFFDRFIAKTYRYASAFLSQGPVDRTQYIPVPVNLPHPDQLEAEQLFLAYTWSAKVFILENGNEVQKKLFLHMIGECDLGCAIEAFKRYQNEDGGWANGLEIEYNGNVSTPMTTAAALGYIYLFDLSKTKLFSRTLHYLKSMQKENGSWDDPEEITRFELPPYMGPGIYVEFKTGMIIKWLSRLNLNTEDREMIIRTRDYLIDEFPQVSKGDDMWSAISYINAFGELPPSAK